MESTSKVLLGVLGGVAVGAVLGILFAPDKGSNTRKKLVDQGKDLVDQGKHYADNFKGKIDEIKRDVTNKYENFVSDAKEATSGKV
jgi:gas vesicle protein